jgi:chromosome partitioning protein
MIISILNQKGGSGKTTLAINMAREYTKRGFKTLLVDCDAQGSALRWHEESGGDLIDLTCLPINTMDKDVVKFKSQYERIIIDGKPSMCRLLVCGIMAANVVLIPVEPSCLNVWATEPLVKLIKERIEITEGKLKAAFVVSQCVKGTILGRDITEKLEKLELPVFSNRTHQLQEYMQSFEQKRTVCERNTDAMMEIVAITNELEDFYHGKN